MSISVRPRTDGVVEVNIDVPTLRAVIVGGVVEAWEPRTPPPPIKGVGDHMKDVIHERRPNAPSECETCSEWIATMNAWGPNECERRADEIAAHLVSQADKLGVAVGLIVALLPPAERKAEREARAMLAEAIRRTRTATAGAA